MTDDVVSTDLVAVKDDHADNGSANPATGGPKIMSSLG